ncbi:UDP-N-acetylglucosamine 2-epimerase (non-hydrolyzing) [Fluviicola taffensis]|uniref:non-hydrolyzing UDP-N-acetylglucosamine 2-epimerase n=1 Tax=Fluviicola taffensis TaxID=191579 RepID=UPI0031383824
MHITLIAGARPNFMKIAPIIHAIHQIQAEGSSLRYSLVHTGQHYDEKMSGQFFAELEIPEPNENLQAGGGTQAEQTAAIMIRFEKYLETNPTDLVLVVGDVTSTMACAIVAQKARIKVAHVEGGIRSNDWTMPEEINRLVTDAISDYFFTTSEVANENLRKIGVKEEKIHFVGNTMIDTLLKQMPRFKKPELWDKLQLIDKEYLVLTLHRPSNVDEETKLKTLIDQIISSSEDCPIVFPVHPRTAKMIELLGISHPRLHMVDSMGYLEFNYLVQRAKLVVTDSGGITEETTVMQVPCMTLRDTTERPETVTDGTNELVGTDPKEIEKMLKKCFSGNWKTGSLPALWDGKTAERIVEILTKLNH